MERNLPVVFASEPLSIEHSTENDVNTIKHGVAYSGGIINTVDSVGMPIDIIFDLSSLHVKEERYPLLYAHDDRSWVGSFEMENDHEKLEMHNFRMLDNPLSKMVADALKADFPVKTSVRIMPKQVDYIGEKESIINGIPVSNAFVYRDSTISEVSVTSIPRDGYTSLSLFADTQNQFKSFNVRSTMTEKVEDHAILPQEFAKQQKIIADLQAQLASQNKMLTTFSEELESQKAVAKKLLAERDQFAEESAQLALQIRTDAIAELESMLGEFNESEKEWLLNLLQPDFQMFVDIMKSKFEKNEATAQSDTEMIAIPTPQQMSEDEKHTLLSPHLFTNQARTGKSTIGETDEDQVLQWARLRNGVTQ